jgi:hypothetical protein
MLAAGSCVAMKLRPSDDITVFVDAVGAARTAARRRQFNRRAVAPKQGLLHAAIAAATRMKLRADAISAAVNLVAAGLVGSDIDSLNTQVVSGNGAAGGGERKDGD